jgi:secreted Zn-dependent insulinase-like peptidase
MQYYPAVDYLTGEHLLFDYDPEVIAAVTESLTADGVCVMWSSQQFREQCHLREYWFGTHHSCEDIPTEWKEVWKTPEVPDYIHLPPPNPFIATDFTIKSPPSEIHKYPVVVSQDSKHRLWFRQDTTFKTPRASVCLLLENPVHEISAKNAVLLDIFVNVLTLNMSDTVYNADIALLKYDSSVEHRGVVITVSGLNEKLPLFFKKIVDSMVTFSTTQEDFNMIKEGVRRSYHNSSLDPEDHCRSVRLKVLLSTYWSSSEKVSEIEALTIEDLTELVSHFRTNLFVDMLAQGNMTPEEAVDLAGYLCSEMEFDALSAEKRYKPCVVKLPAGRDVCVEAPNRDPGSPNAVTTDYYQCCPRTVKDSAITSFLSHCMEEPAFDDLRTKKQLGYEVYVSNHNTHNVTGLSLTVVSQTAKNSTADEAWYWPKVLRIG